VSQATPVPRTHQLCEDLARTWFVHTPAPPPHCYVLLLLRPLLCCAGSAAAAVLQAAPEAWTHQLCDELGLTLDELQTLDSEGRALVTDHGLFVLVNLYGEGPP
jgi:hypothetical protein